MPTFVNRERELDRLHELYESDSAELSVVYGRRRMGKTTLVVKSIEDRDDARHARVPSRSRWWTYVIGTPSKVSLNRSTI
jgi:Predicted ATPase (AAA+ superfamily)